MVNMPENPKRVTCNCGGKSTRGNIKVRDLSLKNKDSNHKVVVAPSYRRKTEAVNMGFLSNERRMKR